MSECVVLVLDGIPPLWLLSQEIAEIYWATKEITAEYQDEKKKIKKEAKTS